MSSIEPQTTSPVLSTTRIHPPVLAAALLLGTLALHFILPEARAVGWYQLIGLLLVAAGAGLSSFAAALFSGAQHHQESVWRAGGIYRAAAVHPDAKSNVLGHHDHASRDGGFLQLDRDVDSAGGLLRGDRSNGDSARGRNDGAALRPGLHRVSESGQTLALKL
jgi:hypothetical protein